MSRKKEKKEKKITVPHPVTAVPHFSAAFLGAQEIVELMNWGGADALSCSISTDPDPASGVAPLEVSFAGSASGGVAPYSYSWNFGEGQSSAEKSPSHRYENPGEYTATLTVTDSAIPPATCAESTAVLVESDVNIEDGLVGHWSFDEDSGTIAEDSSGNNYHGTLVGDPQWVAGKVHGGLEFDGNEDYVELPIGSLISSLTSSTFATWVDFSGAGGAWQRIFDFGNDTTVNMFLTPRTGTTGSMRFAITTSGPGAEQQATAADALPSGWRHVAVTIEADNGAIKLYLDGSVVAENTSATLTPSDLGNTTQNWFGKSKYSGNPDLDGSLDDFRIYNRALETQPKSP